MELSDDDFSRFLKQYAGIEDPALREEFLACHGFSSQTFKARLASYRRTEAKRRESPEDVSRSRCQPRRTRRIRPRSAARTAPPRGPMQEHSRPGDRPRSRRQDDGGPILRIVIEFRFPDE